MIKSQTRTQPRQLFSGIYQCYDCNTEWEFTHARELRCPECGGDDLEPVQLDEEAEQHD